jgi:thioredoxin 1
MAQTVDIIGEKEFKEKVIDSKAPVLVDFWAEWCMPCRMMAPILEELSDEFDGKLTIAKVDTENPENRSLSHIFQISSIPNMKLFIDGKIAQDFVGFRPKAIFKKELESSI